MNQPGPRRQGGGGAPRSRDRNWGKVFTLSVIKAPKVDFYGHGARADYQKNWDLGLTYQNELRASMKNLAYAMRRDERAHQHNLLRWMICGSTPSDISDACIGAINSLMCVSFIMRRLQPLVGERHATDQSYTVYFRQDKSELKDLYQEIEVARNFLWCIDMIYKSTLPAMNINSISSAPHAADRAAENQDRRKWVSWPLEIVQKAEKENTYTIHEADRELERYPEDFAIGEEPTRWVMGSSKTEPSRFGQRNKPLVGQSPSKELQVGGRMQAMLSRSTTRSSTNCWARHIHLIRRGYYSEWRNCQCEVQHRVPNHTNCIWAASRRWEERDMPPMVRQHRKRMMRRRTFLRTTTWTRKDTRPATCLRKKMAVGNTATMTWHRGISLIPSGWRFALMSRAKLNTWRDSSRCRCQRCGGCSKVVKRERSMPRSKGSMPQRLQEVPQHYGD